MTNYEKPKDVSSAEITATYRSMHPEISGDHLSHRLVGKPGQAKAAAFIEKYDYPLASRKISLASAFVREQANRLLATGLYDSVICFASGLSLLSYYIKQDNPQLKDLVVYDTDLQYMVEERLQRVHWIEDDIDQDILASIKVKAFDIEQAFQDKVDLKQAFPDCKNPIFIADGIVYYLSEGCNKWLIQQISQYEHSALALYFWHTRMHEQSKLFEKVFHDLNKGMILETLTCLWDAEILDLFKAQFNQVQGYTLAEYEQQLHEKRNIGIELTDINHYFPIHLICGAK